MSRWKSLAREPLVHFIILGAALFGIDHLRRPTRPNQLTAAARPTTPAAPTADRRIVVTADVRAELTDALTRTLGRAPTAAELDGAVEHWLDQEVLFREALLRGLDQDDPIVRDRIATKMGFVVEQELTLPEPTDAELHAWFDAHQDRWTQPPRLDFTHVFIEGQDDAATRRASDLLAKLAAGASPETLGDRFSGGHRYRGRKLADLAATFGDDFVAGLDRQATDTWVLRRSRFGIHLVRVDHREPGAVADFSLARADVRKDLLESRKADAVTAAIHGLRAHWEIVQ